MGMCFKLFGKAKLKDNRISERTGSTFFVAENYLLTCKHLVSALSLGDELFFRYDGTEKEYRAVLEAVAEGWDLALLRTESPAPEGGIFPLDRVVLGGREAVAYGFPHGGVLHAPYGLKIGAELGSGVSDLTNAGAVTVGYSGGPICPASDPGTAIGVLYMIKEEDEYGHLADVAGFVHARIALELWGEQYGLREKRYEVRPDAFGSNGFIYSALKTDFQDPNGYLSQLRSFVEDNRPVLWWAVVGPGGAGKSRLCYELAHSLNSSWRCELLGVEQLKKNHLQKLFDDAGRNFLVLADYAYTNTNELGTWLDERARAMNGPHIRVLLLQRETGRDYFGWQESLLHGCRNLINLRYQKDLELKPPGHKDMVALMRSYAENEGGGQIDAEELYAVLQNVDSGLTRPLFAMFIVDAEMHGGNPRGWNPEKALAYFIRREKDIIEKALKEPKDARVAELLLALATITNGFTFDLGILDSFPLRKLWDFSELPEKESFGLKLDNARLADWVQASYMVKPLKPDLLGEYYVLDMFRKMMNDPKRKEAVAALLSTAKETDMIATVGFVMRLFNDYKDYKIDEEIYRICFDKKDGLFSFSAIYGRYSKPNTELLRELYRVYGTNLWLDLYSGALSDNYTGGDDPKKKKEVLNELRILHRDHPKNYSVADSLVHCLYFDIPTIGKQSDGYTEFDEIRAIYEEQPGNIEVAKVFVLAIIHEIGRSFVRDSVSIDRSILLKELHKLCTKEPKNTEVAEEISNQLGNALVYLCNYQEAILYLDGLRTLYSVYQGNVLIAKWFALGLSNAMELCSAEIDGKALMEELHALHRDYPGNASITASFAKGISAAIRFFRMGEENALLKELRNLHRNHPNDASITKAFASGLSNAIRIDAKNINALLEELRNLHKDHPNDASITKAFASRLPIVIIIDSINEEVLLEELRDLHRDQPDDILIARELAVGLYRVCLKFLDRIDENDLLEELRTLHRDHPNDLLITEALIKGLFICYHKQSGPKKDCTLLGESHTPYDEQRNNDHTAETLFNRLLKHFYKQSNSKRQSNLKKSRTLLDEFRELYKEHLGDYDAAGHLALELTVFYDHQTDLVKADALLDMLHALHEELPENEMVNRASKEIEIQLMTKALLAKNAEELAKLKKADDNNPFKEIEMQLMTKALLEKNAERL